MKRDLEIPSARAAMLLAGGEDERRDALRELRRAWPYRYSFRGRIVARVNVRTLRQLRQLGIG